MKIKSTGESSDSGMSSLRKEEFNLKLSRRATIIDGPTSGGVKAKSKRKLYQAMMDN